MSEQVLLGSEPSEVAGAGRKPALWGKLRCSCGLSNHTGSPGAKITCQGCTGWAEMAGFYCLTLPGESLSGDLT